MTVVQEVLPVFRLIILAKRVVEITTAIVMDDTVVIPSHPTPEMIRTAKVEEKTEVQNEGLFIIKYN